MFAFVGSFNSTLRNSYVPCISERKPAMKSSSSFGIRKKPAVRSLPLCALILACAFINAPRGADVQFTTFYNTQTILYTEPVWFDQYPGERGAFMVGELGGNLFLLEPVTGGYQSVVFGHIPVTKASGNDGLLGVAFHPNFKINHKYYVYYISSLGHGVLEERLAKASFKSDSGYARQLLTSTFGNIVHNGGDVHFGRDGYLYLGFGDAGNPNVYNTNSQDLHLLYGKMIRIDVDRKDAGREYAIPADNPFTGSTDAQVRKEIFAYGLRQPWRWSFDPLDGRMFVSEVGDWVQEEIDIVTKGANYGWSRTEGNTCFNSAAETVPLATCDKTGLTPPLAVVPHNASAASITGGAVFRGNSSSPFYGAYIFGDYITRKLYALRASAPSTVELIGTSPGQPASFGTDSLGNIYLVGHETGIIYRLSHTDLTGVTSIASRSSGRPPKILNRIGGNWRFDDQAFPGMDRLRLAGLDGKILFTLSRNQLHSGFGADLVPGVYLIEGYRSGVKTVFPVLLK